LCFPDIPEQEPGGKEPSTIDHWILVRISRPIDYGAYDVLMVSVKAIKQFMVAFPQGDADRVTVHQMFHCFLLGDAEGTTGWALASLPQNLVPGKCSAVKNGRNEKRDFRPVLDFPKVLPLICFWLMIFIDFEVVGFCYCEISLNSFTPSDDVRPYFPCYFPRCHLCIVILPSIGFWCSFPVLFVFPTAPVSFLVWLPEIANSWSPSLGREG